MDEYERIGSTLILRRHHLHIGLTLHDFLAGFADICSADIEIATLPDCRLIDGRHRQLGCVRSPRSGHQGERGQRQSEDDA
jgi:hypothetical protein